MNRNVYYVWQCFSCGEIQVQEFKKSKHDNRVFKCKYCRKTRQFRRKSELGLSVKVFKVCFNANTASKECRNRKFYKVQVSQQEKWAEKPS